MNVEIQKNLCIVSKFEQAVTEKIAKMYRKCMVHAFLEAY